MTRRMITVSAGTLLGLLSTNLSCSKPKQSSVPESPLAAYPGFGHNHEADEARFRQQELARERFIARCMQQAGYEYTPTPSVVIRTADNRRRELATRPDPNERYALSLGSRQRTRYYLTLFGVPDPHDEGNLWDPRSPTGGGCWGEAMRAIPSVFAAQGELMSQYNTLQRSIPDDSRVRAAEQRWSECMRRRGHDYASPLTLRAELDRAAISGISPDSMAGLQKRNLQAREASRPCSATAGLDSTVASVRIEKEKEFIRVNRAVLDRHRELQRQQVLPTQ